MELLRRSNMPWYVYPTWLLQDIVTPATALVVACYWLGKEFQSGDCPQSNGVPVVSVQTHGVNCVVMLIDAMLNQQPVVLLHSVYFMLYMLLYSVFLGLYCIYSGRSLYGIVAWHGSPVIGALGTVAMVFIICPLVELLLWHWWRLQAASSHGCYTEHTRPSDEEDMPDQPSSFSILFAVKSADFSSDRSKGRLDVVKAFGESGLPGLCQHRKVFLAMRMVLFLYMLSVSVQSISRWGPYQQSAACMTANEAKCSSCEPYWAYLTHWTLTVEVVYLGFACMTTYKLMVFAAPAGDAATPTQTPTQPTVPSPIAAPVAGGSGSGSGSVTPGTLACGLPSGGRRKWLL
jgi:hypothetical protein